MSTCYNTLGNPKDCHNQQSEYNIVTVDIILLHLVLMLMLIIFPYLTVHM